ncbi:transglutaminase domain-containing protein [Treponema socranskii]|uniref:transglutaminase domain-containing protein n=1 Tax=Treponema socranskii TaxID=53419 RepID=UPI003D8C891C
MITMRMRRKPVIESLNPPIGAPGDLVVIKGKNFGSAGNEGYVEFAGSKLTASSYISWTDTEIKVILPATISDGLVFVGTKTSRSEPSFFTNEREIPVAVRPKAQVSVPIIASISNPAPTVGDLVVIFGKNFGNTHDTADVYFTTERETPPNRSALSYETGAVGTLYIPASKSDFDYEFWSDTEIRVRVPDGAASGSLYVETPAGRSASQKIVIDPRAGSKAYGMQRTYIAQLAADINNIETKQPATIRFYFPRPVLTAAQPFAELSECDPEPAIADYQNTIVHQLQATKGPSPAKRRFSQNFVISVYEVKSTVQPKYIRPYDDMNKALYASATRADKFIPSDDRAVTNLAAAIVGKETNPYVKAKLIYSYMLDNYKLRDAASKPESPLNLIKSKRGDAYCFALLYTALLRAAGIPALTDCGVLVDRDLHTRNHWWCEFYLHGVGWIPVDPSLGAGLSYEGWGETGDARNYYFGNLDSQHITFSRGINDLKPGAGNTKIVQHPRGYALQSVWEESSQGTVQYSSFWADPAILGVY